MGIRKYDNDRQEPLAVKNLNGKSKKWFFFLHSFKLHELANQQYCISFRFSHNLFTAARRQDPLGNVPNLCNVTSYSMFHLAIQLTDVTKLQVAGHLPQLGQEKQFPQLHRRKTANDPTLRLNYFKLICTWSSLSKDTFISQRIAELFWADSI